MNIIDIFNFSLTDVTVVDIALISISPIAVAIGIVKYRSQISQFIRQLVRVIRISGKNVATALQAGLNNKIIPKVQPANINQEETPEAPLEPDLHEIREALKAYIASESHILELQDFGEDNYIGYSCGYEPRKIWLTIWIGNSLDIIAIRLMYNNGYLSLIHI